MNNLLLTYDRKTIHMKMTAWPAAEYNINTTTNLQDIV